MASPERIARLRIQLDDFEPPIWRRVEVPFMMHLKGLHGVIQAVMLFGDHHLFEFRVGDRRYAVPDREWDLGEIYAASNLRIGALVERDVTTFAYTYDFGDNWQHTITIEDIGEADAAFGYPRFVDGARRAPPEDVGGIPGFGDFLQAMADPEDERHAGAVAWYGRRFDPDDIDRAAIDAALERVVRKRAQGRAGYMKNKSRLR